jgi:hypothetical protein
MVLKRKPAAAFASDNDSFFFGKMEEEVKVSTQFVSNSLFPNRKS